MTNKTIEKIEITYKSSKGSIVIKQVEPLRFDLRSDGVYIVGLFNDKEVVFFNVDRIIHMLAVK